METFEAQLAEAEVTCSTYGRWNKPNWYKHENMCMFGQLGVVS